MTDTATESGSETGTRDGLDGYEPYRLSGLWHVHTDVTDGANSVDELLSFATDENFPLIGFVEHVRRSPSYDFAAFYESVHARASAYDIECVVGCEAKVLNADGELDVSSDVAGLADVVYAAYHGSPFDGGEDQERDEDAYVESIHAMLENPIVDVWAHPFAYAVREGVAITRRERAAILDYAVAEHVLLEYNLRHESLLSPSDEHPMDIIGYDLHDRSRWERTNRDSA